MNAADRRIAQQVEHRARLALYDSMTVAQRHALRRWLDRACAYRERFPDAPLDEVRSAARALRDVPLNAYAQARAEITEQQAAAELDQICADVRRQHHPEETNHR
ncbi:MAG: hypothetical protein IPK26_10960 [Planctomycetes bacterium]|nr:hypothetical protein [Planctomycetota bacterium]